MNYSVEAKLQIANLILVAVTIIAGFVQLRLFRKQLVREHRKARSERALSYFASHLPEIREIRTRLEKAFPWQGDPAEAPSIPLNEVSTAFETQKSLNDDAVAILGHWESMALTIAAGFTDERLAFEMLAGSVVKWVNRFRSYIDHRRAASNPRLYDYLLPLAEQWRLQLKTERTHSKPYFYRVRQEL